MTTTFTFTAYGPPATAALGDAIAAAKGDNLLAPVTVVVPSNLVGVSARRTLAARSPTGLVAVQFETVLGLARRLAGPSLSGEPRRVTDPVVGAAVRSVLESSADLLRPVARHPATERALVRVHRELRELDDDALTVLAGTGPRAAEVVRLHREVHNRLTSHYVDEVDLHRGAAATVADDHPLLDELGAVVLHLLRRIPASGLDLLTAIGEHRGLHVVAGQTAIADAPTARVVERLVGGPVDQVPGPPTPDPSAVPQLAVRSLAEADEEASYAVREVLDAAAAGIPFSRMAIVHPASGAYGRLLHQHLRRADVRFNGVADRRLSESVSGRTILGLLGLPDDDYSRVAVMALLAPGILLDGSGKPVPVAAWERIARRAGIVAGLHQWRDRIDRFVTDQAEQREALAVEGVDPGRLRYHDEESDRANALQVFIESLAADLDPVARPRDWPGLSRWAVNLLERLVGHGDVLAGWPDEDADAHAQVLDTLRSLAGLSAVEPDPAPTALRRVVADCLDRITDREGLFGTGVLVGGFGVATGLDLDLVVVVGLAEGLTPARRREDPLLPDSVRKAVDGALDLRADQLEHTHHDVLAALGAAGTRRVMTFPRGTLGSKVENLPSRWLLDEIEPLLGIRPTPEELTNCGAPWFTMSKSYCASLESTNLPIDHHQYALAHLLRDQYAGKPIDDSPRRSHDNVLDLGIDLVRGRERPVLTRFDGCLTGLRVPSPTDGRTTSSATRLETWVRCPHAYFMREVLGIQAIEDPADLDGIDPRERGSLAHRVLERLVDETLQANDVPTPDEAWSPAHHQRLDRLCDDEFTLAEQRGLTGRPILWQPESERLRRMLHEFLRRDDGDRPTHRGVPFATEWAFGRAGTDPYLHPLPDGRRLALAGNVDRVDRIGDHGVVVTDYKTGLRSPFEDITPETPDGGGEHLQLGIYGLAVGTAFNAAAIISRYWFFGHRDEPIGYTLTPEIRARFDKVLTVIADGIEQGIFPARPPETEFGRGCPYCSPDGRFVKERTSRWAVKRTDPILGPYRDLIGDLVTEITDA